MLKHTHILLLIGFCFLASGLAAQPKGYKAVSDEPHFRAVYLKAAQNSKSVKSDFTQEKNLSMLDEKIVSKGQFHYKQQNKVRMEYQQPFSYLLIINQDKIFIKDGQKTSTFSSADNKLFRQVNRILLDCVSGAILSNKDFKTAIFEDEGTYLLFLYPQNKDIKGFFESISLYVDKKDLSIRKMEMTEAMGDSTILTFYNKQLNIEISDALFTVH